MPFQYKRILLVGATAGIGAAMADKLIQEGAKVIAVGRRQDRLDAFVEKHGKEYAGSARFDITDKAGQDAFVKEIVETYPDLDCVFLNSGIQSQTRLTRPEEVDLDAFHAEVNTNFNCIVDLMIKFLPHLQAKPQPTSIIVTTSLLAMVPSVASPAYSASKAALTAFIDCLRAQTEKVGSRTKIVEVRPPLTQTELHDYMGEARGRSMGIPVDVFTESAYAQLAAGQTLVPVGALAPGMEKQMEELVKVRKDMTDKVSAAILAHFQL
ncbi:NAD(P)-binding protein [Thozetella sp. PMI_491]|nr:NAD(P)-binding protein [Thozetella sp. PMI_491]